MAEEKKTEAPPSAGVKIRLEKEHNPPSGVLSLDAAADGRRVYVACMDGGVYEVDAASGKTELLGRHESYASGARLLRKTGFLVSAGYDGAVKWLDLAARKTIRSVQAHRFWSWKLAVSPDENLVASVTGQYQAGGYKYEPAPETEPSVKVFDARDGSARHSFSHLPPVLSVAFSPDSRYLAAANMMGTTRVWDAASGKLEAEWNSAAFTSWGKVKSHHYIGGVYGLTFTPDGAGVVLCGFGPMNDPMAGNGRQTWQRYDWRAKPAQKTGEIAEGDAGNGLMEVISFHPAGRLFLMGGRLAQGKWNTALFESGSGKLAHSLDTKMRVTGAAFTEEGSGLILGGATGQEKTTDKIKSGFGRLKIYRLTV
jgi:WD40 repeat protein